MQNSRKILQISTLIVAALLSGLFQGCHYDTPKVASPTTSPTGHSSGGGGWQLCGLGSDCNNIYPVLLLDRSATNAKDSRQPNIPAHDLLLRLSLGAELGDTQFRVDVRETDWIHDASYYGRADKAGLLVFPIDLPWRWDKVLKNSETRPIEVDLKVSYTVSGSENNVELAVTFYLHAANDCPDQNGKDIYRRIFASYVDEDSPLVPQLVTLASQEQPESTFRGYAAPDNESRQAQVYSQMLAVWLAFQKVGVHYTDISTLSESDQGVSSQYVRLLPDSIRDASANCIDGSVALASVYRRIGLEPALVFVPGHCFLAVWNGNSSTDGARPCFFLETTLIGTATGHDGFDQALNQGSAEFHPHISDFNAKQNPEYQVVDIKTAREEGYLPIPQ